MSNVILLNISSRKLYMFKTGSMKDHLSSFKLNIFLMRMHNICDTLSKEEEKQLNTQELYNVHNKNTIIVQCAQ